MSIARQLRAEGDQRPTVLVYGNRVEEQIVYREELDTLNAASNIEVMHALSEPPAGWSGRTGMVDADLIRAIFDDPERRQWLFVLCGPPEMLAVVEDTLLDMGILARQILSERFKYD